jgi:hypothetical protein
MSSFLHIHLYNVFVVVNDDLYIQYYGSLVFKKHFQNYMRENRGSLVYTLSQVICPPPLKNLFSALFGLEFWL